MLNRPESKNPCPTYSVKHRFMLLCHRQGTERAAELIPCWDLHARPLWLMPLLRVATVNRDLQVDGNTQRDIPTSPRFRADRKLTKREVPGGIKFAKNGGTRFAGTQLVYHTFRLPGS